MNSNAAASDDARGLEHLATTFVSALNSALGEAALAEPP